MLKSWAGAKTCFVKEQSLYSFAETVLSGPRGADLRIKQLDEFYSAESPQLWKLIIGEDLHYHYGVFTGRDNSLQDGLRHAVRSLYDYIPNGGHILDAGCGWGGPAKMLETELACTVQGVTLSSAQFNYCRSLGMDVMLGDLESMDLSGHRYDAVLMMESLDHIQHKGELLTVLRGLAPKIILRVNCVASLLATASSQAGRWHMYMETPEMIQRRLERAGWNLIRWVDRRTETLLTFSLWHARLESVFPDADPPGQLGLLKQLCEYALSDLDRWADANPLMEYVAV